MGTRNTPLCRYIFQNANSGATIFAERAGAMEYRSIVTGKLLAYWFGKNKWREADTGETFFLRGLEVTDGVLTKTYTPIPNGFLNIRYSSGKALYALLTDSGLRDALTEAELSLQRGNEAWVGDMIYPGEGLLDTFMTYEPEEDEGIPIAEDIKTGEEISVSPDAFYAGTYVVGVQGSGKTSILTNIGIEQMWEGDSVIVLDPTGDMIRDIISRMPKDRIKDTYLFSIKEYKTPFMMSVFSPPEQTKGVKLLELQQGTRNQIIAAFEKLWPEVKTGQYFKKMLRNIIPILLEHPRFTLYHVPDFFDDDQFRERVLSELHNKEVQAFWTSYAGWSRSEKERQTQPFRNRVDELLDDAFVKFHICPKPSNIGENGAEKKRTIDIRQLILDRKIVLIHLPLDELSYRYSARTIGIFFMMQIYAATFSFASMPKDERPGFTLLVDEFSKWATGSADEFRDLFSFGRKYGIKQVLCHQYLGQLEEEGMGALKQAMTTAHTVIALRTNRDDSPYLSHLFAGYEYEDYGEEVEKEADEEEEAEEFTRKPTIINVEPISEMDKHPNPLVRDFYVRYLIPLQTGARMGKGTTHKYNFGFGEPIYFEQEAIQELLRRYNRFFYDTQVAGVIDEAKLHTFVYETCLPAIGSDGQLPYDMVPDEEGVRKRGIVQVQIRQEKNTIKRLESEEQDKQEIIRKMQGAINEVLSESRKIQEEWRTRYPRVDWGHYSEEYKLGTYKFDSQSGRFGVWYVQDIKEGKIHFQVFDLTKEYTAWTEAEEHITKLQKLKKETEEKIQKLQWQHEAIPIEKKAERTGMLVQFEQTLRVVLEALLAYPIAVDRAEVEREREKWEKEQERKRVGREKRKQEREEQEQEREASAHKILSASDVASILPKLKNRHGFVKVASEIYRMKTIDLPAPVGGEEKSERWNTILAQTKRTYCRGRKEVERELTTAFMFPPTTNQTPPIPHRENKQMKPEIQRQTQDLFDRLDEHEGSPDIQ
ncbi:hypothetical protein KSF_084240 [Reticulibacter mediterranei]|uniref:TraD/TraG TraM recognition site domain-containing protein n=1 Tax=Reticulibacter mediterranei TaxID=2778369 RepID=A0A8J3J018_9CHLR|nr:type IV secretory system conjugative DNA transfer family protein [Reticulibacter mediterranei]GHO98376.1 hypothetical protein KSF_084240 [Reticulibacter mediterranei]